MTSMQISLTLPKELFEESRQHSQVLGFRSVQEFILDAVRRRVVLERRAKLIEERMIRGKGVKTFTPEEAKKFLETL